VTDANLVLGRLDPAHFLGGEGDVTLDRDTAHTAVAELGDQLGLTAEETALGIVRVANATMERALRRVSIERGYNPSDFVLVPFGGAGPLHACDLAEALGVRRILVPPNPGVLSALGLLVADIVHDRSYAILRPAEDLMQEPSLIETTLLLLKDEVQEILKKDGFIEIAAEAALDVRYQGQSYELTVPLDLPVDAPAIGAAVESFHSAHRKRYGYAMPEEPVEVVTLRLRGIGGGARPNLPREPLEPTDARAALLGTQPIWFNARQPLNTPCYERRQLQPGNHFAGPAIVFQYDTTTVLGPGWQASVDPLGNLWLEAHT
jgi:N-methylhydantoinase A